MLEEQQHTGENMIRVSLLGVGIEGAHKAARIIRRALPARYIQSSCHHAGNVQARKYIQ